MKYRGFTLLEVVVSVAILALVVGAGWFSFSSYAARRELDSGAARVAALITEARSKTLAGENSSAYGVHFESDRAVLFRAPTYQAGSSDNKTEMLARRITISTISFSGNEVIFKRLTGAAVSAGSITLLVRGNPSVSKTVSVNTLGTVESE
ncbi:MAG: prepilin-type N-terminal cleavage/methylation domain-containing protein [bacterium]|nr:prepilin-type N-terminal cleavage/methylation domain-containing protein [bacterium]